MRAEYISSSWWATAVTVMVALASDQSGTAWLAADAAAQLYCKKKS